MKSKKYKKVTEILEEAGKKLKEDGFEILTLIVEKDANLFAYQANTTVLDNIVSGTALALTYCKDKADILMLRKIIFHIASEMIRERPELIESLATMAGISTITEGEEAQEIPMCMPARGDIVS